MCHHKLAPRVHYTVCMLVTIFQGGFVRTLMQTESEYSTCVGVIEGCVYSL
jgi:hypothetical protein